MKQKIIVLVLSVCACFAAKAQFRHEFSVSGGGGLSSLQYSYSGSKQTSGFGFEAGLGYHYFFAAQWAVRTGINISQYNSSATMDNYSARHTATLPNGTAFNFTYAYTNYEEKVSATLLTIPVMLQFQTAGKTIFYGALGVKIGVPLDAGVTTTGQLNTTGEVPEWMITIDDQPARGFGEYNVKQDSELALKVGVMLSAEAGVKFRLNEKLHLYTGLYFDYGLNNMNKNETNLLHYQASATTYPAGFEYGSLAGMSDRLAPLAFGATVRLSFGKGILQTKNN